MLWILHADHEQNCSTSAVRAVGSSQVDPYSAVAAGVAALYGPLHGGANEAVLRMLDRIETVENIPDFLQGVKDGKEKLMGFGHRVYKNYDPRARIIKKNVEEVFEVTGKNPKLEIAVELEKRALDDEYFTERKLYPNVDFYSGLIYEALQIPTDMFTVMFAIPRTSGWIAQWLEMVDDEEHEDRAPAPDLHGRARPRLRADRPALAIIGTWSARLATRTAVGPASPIGVRRRWARSSSSSCPGFVLRTSRSGIEYPALRRFFERLASFSTLLLYDKRGPGPVRSPNRAADARGEHGRPARGHPGGWLQPPVAVRRLGGRPDGAPLRSAATRRTSTSSSCSARSREPCERDDFPIGFCRGRPTRGCSRGCAPNGAARSLVDMFSPSLAEDEAFLAWWARFLRSGSAPSAARSTLMKLYSENRRHAMRCPAIEAPTLVLQKAATTASRRASASYLAEQHPGRSLSSSCRAATICFFTEDQDALLDEVEDFLTGARVSARAGAAPRDGPVHRHRRHRRTGGSRR